VAHPPVERGLSLRSRCVQGNNVTTSLPITRYDARFAGEFMVSLPLARLLNDLHKSLMPFLRDG
jgi:hypothetical protein